MKLIMVCTFYLQSTMAAGSNTVPVINQIMFLKRGVRAASAALRPLSAGIKLTADGYSCLASLQMRLGKDLILEVFIYF